MKPNIKISLAITTFNRYDSFLKNYLRKYIKYDIIDEIIINDDCSEDFAKIMYDDELMFSGKIKLFINKYNLGALFNKIVTCNYAKNEWICLADSDNFFGEDYFDGFVGELKNKNYDKKIIYCPTYIKGLELEKYSELVGNIYDLTNWNSFHRSYEMSANTGNYIFNKQILKDCWNELINVKFNPYVEVKYMNFVAIKNNYKLLFVKNMSYTHSVHPGSLYISYATNAEKFNKTYNWTL